MSSKQGKRAKNAAGTAEQRVLVLNGPNLNMLGVRNRDVYGSTTLPEIVKGLKTLGAELRLAVQHLQSNGEGELITAIQEARETAHAIIINAGAYSHTSIALRDALEMFPGPIVEVHLSNIAQREPFRHHSYISEVATGVIFGLGAQGYQLALRAVASLLARP